MRAFTTFLILFACLGAFSQTTIRYVKSDAGGANNGTSWTNAFTTLQDAMAVVTNDDQIWVAKGTYYPDEGGGKTNDDRSEFFALKNGVAVYGGFGGSETQLTQRNWKVNVTSLCGEIQQDADNTNNSYQVIRNSFINNTAVLDGFTITGGNGNGGPYQNTAGGMYNLDNASPTVANCTFIQNSAGTGGGISNVESSPRLINCVFSGNTASASGGAIFNVFSSSPTLINCGFLGNKAQAGGAVENSSFSSPSLTNCSFWGNSGGAMFNVNSSSPTLTNCILWGNTGGEIINVLDAAPTVTYSIVQGGYSGAGNLNQDPLFVNAATGDLRLQACSPAIDAGDNNANNTATDLDGNIRKIDAIAGGNEIDMGAYEFQGDLDADNDGYAYCNNEDCNDNNPAINVPSTWVLDKDEDGYYTGTPKLQCATPGAGYIVKTNQQAGDCNDNDPTVNPGAVEVCGNGKNDNCNSATDEQPCYACQNATSFSTTNITCNSATLNWVSIPHPGQWQVRYKTTATGSKWIDVVLSGNKRSANITGLAANQNYHWHIRARCGKNWTDYSSAISFKTLKTCASSRDVASGVSLNKPSGVSGTVGRKGALELYPNPSNGQFVVDLRLDENSSGTARVQLIDISGRTMQTESVVLCNGTLQKTIRVSPVLVNGIYMIRITTAAGKVYSRKLVLEKP